MKYFCRELVKAVSHTAFFICAVFLLSGCNKTPDEEQLQKIISEMISAIENKRLTDIADHLHANFQANRRMDAIQVKQMLMVYGMQHAHISVNLISSQTTLDPIYRDKAFSTLSIIVTGSSSRGLPDDGSIRVVKLEWRKDDEWKLLKAEWEM